MSEVVRPPVCRRCEQTFGCFCKYGNNDTSRWEAFTCWLKRWRNRERETTAA